jgi:hypothetical protein
MEQLRQCVEGQGVRSCLAALAMLGFHIALPWVDMSAHIPEAEVILEDSLRRCPDGAMFLWIAGRVARLKREIPRSIEVRALRVSRVLMLTCALVCRRARVCGGVFLAPQLFSRCSTSVSETDWVQLQVCASPLRRCRMQWRRVASHMCACMQHLCEYEIGWCHYFEHNWDAALPLFAR